MINEIQPYTKVKINLDIEEIGFNQKQQEAIYRIIQEAITNCIKYSDSETMNIEILHKGNEAYIQIQDNGEGCLEIKEGIGLKSIRERVRMINGVVIIESDVDRGFQIRITFPIGDEKI